MLRRESRAKPQAVLLLVVVGQPASCLFLHILQLALNNNSTVVLLKLSKKREEKKLFSYKKMKVKHQFIHFIEAVNVPLPLFKGDLFLFPPFLQFRVLCSFLCM